MILRLLSLIGLALTGCAGRPDLPFFRLEGDGRIEPNAWWNGGMAPETIAVALPVNSDSPRVYMAGSIIFKNGRIIERDPYVMSRLRSKRLAVLAHPRLVLDYTDYTRTHPSYKPPVDESRLPLNQRGKLFATSAYQYVDMLRDDMRMQVIGGTNDNLMYSISHTPPLRLTVAEVLAAEPKGDYVLDNGIEVFRLHADGTLELRLRYRIAERSSGTWVTNHTCTGTTYAPMSERYLHTPTGTQFVGGTVFSINRICAEAGRRDIRALAD